MSSTITSLTLKKRATYHEHLIDCDDRPMPHGFAMLSDSGVASSLLDVSGLIRCTTQNNTPGSKK